MAILVACRCGRRYQTAEGNAGRAAHCPDCGLPLTVPEASPFSDDDRPRLEWVRSPRSGRALASLGLGVLSLGCLFLAGLPAIALGLLALSEIRGSRGRIRGAGMATAGIALGLLGSTAMSYLLLFPAAVELRDRRERAVCAGRLKKIGLAMHNYHAQRNHFPPAAITDRAGRPLLSWRVALLPYLGPEGAALHARFNLSEPWDSATNLALVYEMPEVFRCPADAQGRSGSTRVQGVIGPRTMFTGGKPVRLNDVTDGTSNTILVGEADIPDTWTAPRDLAFDLTVPSAGFGGGHNRVFHVLLVDGSVRAVRSTLNPGTLGALMTRDGGEVITNGSY